MMMPKQLEELPAEVRIPFQEALKLMANSQGLKVMLAQSKESLLMGDADQDPKELAGDIINWRKNTIAYTRLQELGESLIKKEQDDEEN